MMMVGNLTRSTIIPPYLSPDKVMDNLFINNLSLPDMVMDY